MYSEFFNWLIQSSLKASLIILIVLFLRKFFEDKINARWYMILWTIVTIRLILPWAPQTNTSMFNVLDLSVNVIQSAIITGENIENEIEKSKASINKSEHNKSEYFENHSEQDVDTYYFDISPDINSDTQPYEASAINKTFDSRLNVLGHDISHNPQTPPLLYLILIFWIVGLLAFYSYIVLINIKFYRKIKDKKPITDERIYYITEQCRKQLCIKIPITLFETGAVEGPSIYGIFNPIILIPKNMLSILSDSEIRCILIHEFMHYRRKDNIFNLFTMVISGLHWFNPLVHIAFAMMRHDSELLCDSRVLKHISGEEYIYGKTLIKLACNFAGNSLIISEGMGGNGKGLKERIKRIAGTARYKAGWSIIAILMVIIVGCTGLSNEKAPYEPDIFYNLEPVNLNFYTQGYNGSTAEIGDMLKEIEQKLTGSLRITPVFHWIPYEEYDDKLKTLITSGEAVDAFTSYTPRTYVQEDVALDISALFPQYAPEYYEQLKSNEAGEMLLESVTVDDKQYMIPRNYFDCPRFSIAARKDLVSKYSDGGFETLEEYGDFLKAVKENENRILPGFIYSRQFFDAYIKGNGYYMNNASWFYSKFDSKQPALYPITDLNEFIDAYNLLKNWKDNGYVIANNSIYNYTDYLPSGGLASFMLSGRSLEDNIKLAVPGKFEYGIYPLYMNSIHELPVSSRGLVVSKHSKNPQRVLMFIEWLHSSQENYDLFIYGIQDKNYELKGDNIYIPADMKLLYWDIMGSDFFKDYRFARSSLIGTNESRKILLDASLKNVITSDELTEEIFGKDHNELFDDLLKDKEWQEEINNMYKNLNGIFDKYFDNMKTFCKYIDSGLFIMTPQKLQENQKEAGVDKIIEYYEKVFERYRR